jgi:hypothetical protein
MPSPHPRIYVGPPRQSAPTKRDLDTMVEVRGLVPDSIIMHHEVQAVTGKVGETFAASAVLVQDFARGPWRPELTPATEALIAEAVRRG